MLAVHDILSDIYQLEKELSGLFVLMAKNLEGPDSELDDLGELSRNLLDANSYV